MQELAIAPKPTHTFRIIARALAGLNIVFCLVGLLLELVVVIDFLRRGSDTGVHSNVTFWILTTISTSLLFSLLVGSIYFIGLRRRGLAICLSIFSMQLMYGILLMLMPTNLLERGRGWVGMAVTFDTVLYYPLIGLCGTLFLLRKSNQIEWK